MKLILLLSLSFASNAHADIYIEHCSNYGDKIEYGFLSCINRNFDTIETEINFNSSQQIYLSYCSNYGDKLDYSFQSCVNDNFRSIGRVKDGFFSHCSNFKDKGVDYSYVSCLNSNFATAARIINKDIAE
jgi:hypothetical protein